MKFIEKMKAGERALIVCIGDSITEQNFHHHNQLNYVGLLNQHLLQTFGRTHLILNAGVSGDTTWGIKNRLDSDVIRFQPDLVTLMIGMNDSVRGIEQIEEFKQNLEVIIDAINEAGSELILVTQNPISYELHMNVERRKHYPQFVEALREIASKKGTLLCDLYDAWEKKINGDENAHLILMNDGIHPNEHGSKFMADVLIEFISNLNKND